MKNILFIGPPGAGKGTQSANIIRDFDIVQISTGDILRSAVANGTELGKIVKQSIANGELVADSVVIDIIKERLSHPDCSNGFIMDGFPRTIPQAEALDIMLRNSFSTELSHVITLNVADEVVLERITGRRVCSVCGRSYHIKYSPPKVDGHCDFDNAPLVQRDDDTIKTVAKRLSVYHSTTELIIPYYTTKMPILVVDGMRDPDIIYNDIKEFIK